MRPTMARNLRTPLCCLGSAAVVVGIVAGCGSGSSPGVVTNPPVVSSSSGTTGGGPSASGVPASGVRTILATLGLNLRSAPSKDAQVIGSLAQGTVVTVLAHTDQNGGWFQVKGESLTGWMTDSSSLSSAHRFNLYQSDVRGFSALYYDNWTFGEEAGDVVFRQQSGPETITTAIGASLDAFGPPGKPGYSVVSANSIEVYGVTGLLRLYDRTGTVAPASPGAATPLDHLAEYRATIDAKRAIRIDFYYQDQADLPVLRDFYNSVIFPPPATSGAAPATSPTP